MIIAFLSRFIPGFEAACTRLRLNHGKPKDPFADLKFLIDHYLQRGELDRAEALSHSLVALAEGDAVRWADPELFPARKSLRYKRDSRKTRLICASLLLVPLLVVSQHQWILNGLAKDKMKTGHVKEAISLLRSELAIESLLSKVNSNASLTLADALICDYQLQEAQQLVGDELNINPRNRRAIYFDLQIAMLTGQGKRANLDALAISNSLSKKELFATLLLSNVLIGHGPYTDFATMMQLGNIERGLSVYKLIKKSIPEEESDQKLAAAMGYFCKANNDDALAARWFKQSLTLLHGGKFKSDAVRFIDSVHQYVALVGHSKPIEARRLEWTAMGIASQNHLAYVTFEDMSRQEDLSLLQ
jgi:hypothetical protein